MVNKHLGQKTGSCEHFKELQNFKEPFRGIANARFSYSGCIKKKGNRTMMCYWAFSI